MKIIPLHEGSYSVDASKKFIPFNPSIHQTKDRPASLFIHVQPFLIQFNNQLILLDTGLGYKTEQNELVIHKNIRQVGFDPMNVDLVLMSHLHFDHAGGMSFKKDGEKLQPAFPNANYIIQQGEWESAFKKPSESYNVEALMALQDADCVSFVEGNGRVNVNVRYECSGGHSEFHQVFWIEDEKEVIFFGGDTLPEPEQLFTKLIAKYDFDGRKTMELREEYGKCAAEQGWICLFYHATSRAISKLSFKENVFGLIDF